MVSGDGKEPVPASAGVPGRWRSRRLLVGAISAVAVLLVVVLGVVGAGKIRSAEPGAENGAALAARLGLAEDHQCGTRTTSFEAWPGAGEVEVFALDRTWHWVAQCLRAILDRAREKSADASVDDFLNAQVLYALSRPPVRFYRSGEDARRGLADVLGPDGRPDPSTFDRLVYTNEHGVAHNAMSQGALGGWLLEAARYYSRRDRQELATAYRALGNAAFGVILDDVDDGGLRSRSECSAKPGHFCSWFHAVTDQSRESPRAGGTLNKHLIVVLDLQAAANATRGMKALAPEATLRDQAETFEAAALEGMYQLAYAEGHRGTGSAPNLFDYIARDESGAPIADSWLFYGLNPEKTRGGYYLKVRADKNCHYHIFDMRLLHRIFRSVGDGADLSGFTRTDPVLRRSLIEFIVDAYDSKLAAGLFVDTPTAEGGNFDGCPEGLPFDAARFEEVRTYLLDMDATAQ